MRISGARRAWRTQWVFSPAEWGGRRPSPFTFPARPPGVVSALGAWRPARCKHLHAELGSLGARARAVPPGLGPAGSPGTPMRAPRARSAQLARQPQPNGCVLLCAPPACGCRELELPVSPRMARGLQKQHPRQPQEAFIKRLWLPGQSQPASWTLVWIKLGEIENVSKDLLRGPRSHRRTLGRGS